MTSAEATAQPSAKRPDVVGAPRQRTVATAATVSGKGLLLGREATLWKWSPLPAGP